MLEEIEKALVDCGCECSRERLLKKQSACASKVCSGAGVYSSEGTLWRRMYVH